MDRQCPRDFTDLVEETRSVLGPDITVDICPTCQGMFLDKKEIRRLTGDRDLHKLLTKHLGYDSDSELLCPSCGGIMDAEHLEGEAGERVEVDVCLDCNGIWLDAGELAALDASDADFGELTEAKKAELFDAREADKERRRRNSIIARLMRALQRNRR